MRGRNWQYELPDRTTILRNVNSVDPAYDGWWVYPPHSDRPLSVQPQLILTYLRAWRLQERSN